MFFSNVTIIFNKYLLDTAGFRKSLSDRVPRRAASSPPLGSGPKADNPRDRLSQVPYSSG